MLERVQQMQPEAWARLVEVFSPIVYRWARQAGLNAADSADVVQDVFVAVAKNIGNFEKQKSKASFRSWLATITRNRVRDVFRKRKQHPAGMGGTEALERFHEVSDRRSPGPVGESKSSEVSLNGPLAKDHRLEESMSLENLEGSVARRLLEIVKGDCDPKTWQAFWLTTVKGDSAVDVADRLDMNLASVYQAKSRILRRLRKRMDELP